MIHVFQATLSAVPLWSSRRLGFAGSRCQTVLPWLSSLSLVGFVLPPRSARAAPGMCSAWDVLRAVIIEQGGAKSPFWADRSRIKAAPVLGWSGIRSVVKQIPAWL